MWSTGISYLNSWPLGWSGEGLVTIKLTIGVNWLIAHKRAGAAMCMRSEVIPLGDLHGKCQLYWYLSSQPCFIPATSIILVRSVNSGCIALGLVFTVWIVFQCFPGDYPCYCTGGRRDRQSTPLTQAATAMMGEEFGMPPAQVLLPS